MADPQKYVYSFGGGKADGKADMKELLGGKGANLAEMSIDRHPRPPGLHHHHRGLRRLLRARQEAPRGGRCPQIDAALKQGRERPSGKKFGDPADPLLVSVRSGRRAVDAGHDEHHPQPRPDRRLGRGAGQEDRQPPLRLRRLPPRSSTCSAPPRWASSTSTFEHELHALKEEKGVKLDTDLTADDLKELVKRYKAVYKKHVGERLPAGPEEAALAGHQGRVQLAGRATRPIQYRRIERITGLKGTAVNVQAMVFGNMGDDSGTGVAFTRDPNTGENVFYGDYLINAQGEDVVAGIRTPEPISRARTTRCPRSTSS